MTPDRDKFAEIAEDVKFILKHKKIKNEETYFKLKYIDLNK